MNRRTFLKHISSAAAANVFFACKSKPRPPNILFILADDVGVEVPGCYGGMSYQTPNIDQLAKTGIKFTHCYSAPVCSPSRVKLMTGRYGFRTGQEWGHIPDDEITFGHVLKSAGYATAIAGKWQMCLLKERPNHIRKMGFDQSCVFGWHEGPRYYDPLIYQNGRILKNVENEFGPDVYSQFLIDFMRRNRNRPFLAYYSMTLAHEISNDLITPPPAGPLRRYRTYKENIEYADKIIGRLVQNLEEMGLREKTLIMFVGDNGTPKAYITHVENGKYIREPVWSEVNGKRVQGGKSEMTDAGTHVPLIASWPGTTPAGKTCDDLIDFSDFMPTFAELAGTKLPAGLVIDGRSFAPSLLGKSGNPRKWVYTEWEGRTWIRTKRWKLYNDGRLFDMENDPFEKHPIQVAENSGRSAKIRAYLQKQMKELKN